MSHRNDQQHRQQGNGAQHRNQMGGEYNDGPRSQQSAYQRNPGQYGGNYGADTNYSGPQQHGTYETQGNIRGNEDNFNSSFGTGSGGDVLTPYERDSYRGSYSNNTRPDYATQAGGLQDYYDRGFNRGRQQDGRNDGQFAQGYGTRPYGDYDPDYGVRGGYPGYREDAGNGYRSQGDGRQDRQGAGHPHYDPDYHQWRSEQIRGLDDDYRAWRSERYNNFTNEFGEWRKNRQATPAGNSASEAGGKASASDSNSSSSKGK